MKTALIHLPYSNQGPDLAHSLEENGPQGALLLHAELLREVAAMLETLAGSAGDRPVTIEACNSYLFITVDNDIVYRLVKVDLATQPYAGSKDDDGEDEDYEARFPVPDDDDDEWMLGEDEDRLPLLDDDDDEWMLGEDDPPTLLLPRVRA